MIKRVFIFLVVIMALVYCGLKIYYYKKGFRENAITENQKIKSSYNSSDLVILKESFYEFDDGRWKNIQELTDNKSYSQKNSIRIAPETEYAGEIIQSFSEIPSLNNLREVEVTLKIWHEKKVGEGIIWVLEIDGEDGKSLEWYPGDLDAPQQNWETQTFRHKIKTDHLKNFNRIKTYAWNRTKSSCYIDDIRIRYYGLPPENKSNVINSLHKSSFTFDLENTSSLEKTESITEELSHSGKHSSLLNGKNEYSVLIRKKVSEIMNDTITSLNGSVWLYPMSNHPECNFVFEAKNGNDEQIFLYEKKTAKMSLKAGSWQKLNASFSISPEDYRKLSPDDFIYAYVYNNSRSKIFVDDFEITYGNVPDRRGMQIFVDMNSINPDSYQFNRHHPPFPVSYLTNKNIHNNYSDFLIKSESVALGKIKPDQFITSGHFTGSSGHDELLVVSDKEISFYNYCENKVRFISSGSTAYDSNKFPDASFISGDFNGDGKNELLINSGQSSYMYQFETSQKQKCVDHTTGVTMNQIWHAPLAESGTKMFSGKFSDNIYDELFEVNKGGICSFKTFNGKLWTTIASDTVSSIVFGLQSTQVVGRFLNSKSDMILSIYQEKNQTHLATTELINNRIHTRIIPDAELSNDLFHWKDILFSISSKGKKEDDILSFNHQWRFELNYITNDDHSFYVSSKPEFTGYPSDNNPKYYEFPKLISGKFTGNETEMLCILYNCADSNFNGSPCKKYDDVPDLPNSIQLYNFSK